MEGTGIWFGFSVSDNPAFSARTFVIIQELIPGLLTHLVRSPVVLTVNILPTYQIHIEHLLYSWSHRFVSQVLQFSCSLAGGSETWQATFGFWLSASPLLWSRLVCLNFNSRLRQMLKPAAGCGIGTVIGKPLIRRNFQAQQTLTRKLLSITSCNPDTRFSPVL